MNRKHLETNLGEIRHLLSHLHKEVVFLEKSYSEVLSVLRRFESVCNTDDLTGLSRRNGFFKKWEALLKECERLHETCGFIMIDIDNFKQINDKYGHPTGDEAIKKVASILKKFESSKCVAGRLGGEEFGIAIRGTDDDIANTAEAIRDYVESAGDPIKFTVSVGVACEELDSMQLFKEADEALYEAKRNGRNQVCFKNKKGVAKNNKGPGGICLRVL